MKTFVVASNTEATLIIIAETKEGAEAIARGVEKQDWEAYEIDEYFKDEYDYNQAYVFGKVTPL